MRHKSATSAPSGESTTKTERPPARRGAARRATARRPSGSPSARRTTWAAEPTAATVKPDQPAKTGNSPAWSKSRESKNSGNGRHRPLGENEAVTGRDPRIEAAPAAENRAVERNARSAVTAKRKPRAVRRNRLELQTQRRRRPRLARQSTRRDSKPRPTTRRSTCCARSAERRSTRR